jgi:hypothetical protein
MDSNNDEKQQKNLTIYLSITGIIGVLSVSVMYCFKYKAELRKSEKGQ